MPERHQENPMTPRSLSLAAAYVGTIVAANFTLARWGMVPLLGFGPVVPAGVYFAGLSFGVRDAFHERAGWHNAAALVLVGAAVSWFIEPKFAIASGAAFALSELLDLAVYTPLHERRWVTAVIASNIVGSVVDSLLFLTLAFGWAAATDGWFALTVGKAVMILPALAVVKWARR